MSHAPTHQPTHHLPGMFYAIIGYAMMTVFDTLLKQVSKNGYPQWQMMVAVGLFGCLTVTAMALVTGGIRKRLGTQRLGFHLLRGSLSLLGFVCGFYAIRHIQLVDFYGIIFAIPILITVLSVLWLHDQVGLPRWVAIGVGFIGVSIMLHMGMSRAPSADVQWGYWGALGCAVFNAISTIMVRRYGREESNLTFSFYAGVCNVMITTTLWLVYGGKDFTAWDVFSLALAGMLIGVGSVFLMTAFQRSPPAAVAPFQYTQLVWGAVLGYVIFNDVPSFWSLVGAGIVITSGWFVLWREARLAHRLKQSRTDQSIVSNPT